MHGWTVACIRAAHVVQPSQGTVFCLPPTAVHLKPGLLTQNCGHTRALKPQLKGVFQRDTNAGCKLQAEQVLCCCRHDKIGAVCAAATNKRGGERTVSRRSNTHVYKSMSCWHLRPATWIEKHKLAQPSALIPGLKLGLGEEGAQPLATAVSYSNQRSSNRGTQQPHSLAGKP